MTAQINQPPVLRAELGDFSSIVCFRALVKGVHETLGTRAALVALRGAGRKRGHSLVNSLGLAGAGTDSGKCAELLDAALGLNGTRLCFVDKVEDDGEAIRVYLRETICSSGEPQGADTELSFTFGAIHGAMEALSGKKLRGKQVGSVLRGQDHDIVEFHER